jgi:hypothetical protein
MVTDAWKPQVNGVVHNVDQRGGTGKQWVEHRRLSRPDLPGPKGWWGGDGPELDQARRRQSVQQEQSNERALAWCFTTNPVGS